MKSTATLLDDVHQDREAISPPRRGRKLAVAGAACAAGAVTALTFGGMHHSGGRSVPRSAQTVPQRPNVVESVAGDRSGSHRDRDASSAATADDRTAVEVDSVAAIARLLCTTCARSERQQQRQARMTMLLDRPPSREVG